MMITDIYEIYNNNNNSRGKKKKIIIRISLSIY